MKIQRKTDRWSKVRLFILGVIPLMVVLLTSCDSIGDFGDMNTNPTEATTIDPGLQFTEIQIDLAGETGELWRANWHHAGEVIQSVHRGNSAFNYYQLDRSYIELFYNTNYGNRMRNMVDLISNLESMKEEGEEVDNKLAATRIMRVYMFHRITDLYGDIPYFEAGRGYSDKNFTPEYDPQSDIYADMLNELAEAVEQFDESQSTYGTQDLLYNGDIEKWQKFGNSLRLRLALRLVEVDPEMAEQEAVAAINATSGVMTSNEDAAYFHHENRSGVPYMNPHARVMEEARVWFVSQTMVDWLREHNDPRLTIYAAVMNTNLVSVSTAFDHVISTEPEDQLGYPGGYTNEESSAWGYGAINIHEHSSYSIAQNQTPTPENALNGYSRVNPVLWTQDAPSFFQTYAEVALMRAEMIERGWTSGNSEEFYEEGVRAAMTQLAFYNDGNGTTITSTEIDEYLDNNPLNSASAIEQINEQYWSATFLNFIEGWANFRRSGYPDLEPHKVDSEEWPDNNVTNDQWPRRFLYPQNENDRNAESYQKALDRQGLQGLPQDIAVPVWWDAE